MDGRTAARIPLPQRVDAAVLARHLEPRAATLLKHKLGDLLLERLIGPRRQRRHAEHHRRGRLERRVEQAPAIIIGTRTFSRTAAHTCRNIVCGEVWCAGVMPCVAVVRPSDIVRESSKAGTATHSKTKSAVDELFANCGTSSPCCGYRQNGSMNLKPSPFITSTDHECSVFSISGLTWRSLRGTCAGGGVGLLEQQPMVSSRLGRRQCSAHRPKRATDLWDHEGGDRICRIATSAPFVSHIETIEFQMGQYGARCATSSEPTGTGIGYIVMRRHCNKRETAEPSKVIQADPATHTLTPSHPREERPVSTGKARCVRKRAYSYSYWR